MLRTILRKVKQVLTHSVLTTIAICSFPVVSLVGLYRNLEICVSRKVCCWIGGCYDETKSQRKTIRDIYGVDPWYAFQGTVTGFIYITLMGVAVTSNIDHPETLSAPLVPIAMIQALVILAFNDIYYSWLNDVTRFFLRSDQRDWFGNTIVHRRVYAQDFVEVRNLIEQNADLRIRDKPRDVNAEVKTALEISEDLTKNPDPNVHAGKALLTYQSLKKGVESQILNLYRRDANAFANAVYRDSHFVLLPAVGRIIYDYHLGETLENVVESFAPNHVELREALYRQSSALLFSNGLNRNRNLSAENLRSPAEVLQGESKTSKDVKLPEEESGTVIISISLPMS